MSGEALERHRGNPRFATLLGGRTASGWTNVGPDMKRVGRAFPALLTNASAAPVVIVSGAPGSGKTTLARELVKSKELSLHFVSDVFYEFIDSPVDPAKPESRRQNTVLMQALAQSVDAFSRGGYTTFLDGVIGPWFLEVFRESFRADTATHYIVLRASPGECVRRVRERQGSGLSPTAVQMAASFSDLGVLECHVIETTGLDEAEVYRRASEGLAAGAFRLDWTLIPPMLPEADDR